MAAGRHIMNFQSVEAAMQTLFVKNNVLVIHTNVLLVRNFLQ